jgi:hypothetical protein
MNRARRKVEDLEKYIHQARDEAFDRKLLLELLGDALHQLRTENQRVWDVLDHISGELILLKQELVKLEGRAGKHEQS